MRVKPEHDELLKILGRPTRPGTVIEVDGDTIIVGEDGEEEAGTSMIGS